MPGQAPKPASQRINRNKLAFEWVDLPAEGRKGVAPTLPNLRNWSALTVAAWDDWWSTPQAAAWDQSGRSMHRWAVLFDRLATDVECNAAVHVQLTALEDRHGFTPAAMLKLRWRVIGDEVADQRKYDGKATKAERLKAV